MREQSWSVPSELILVAGGVVIWCCLGLLSNRSGELEPVTSLSESFGVRFTGKNYSAWEFQFQCFVTVKELRGHIDGSDLAPTEPKELANWKVKDARVMSWILGFVDPLIVLNLRPYKTAKTMWEYLLKDYFSSFQNLWGEFSDMVYAKVLVASLSAVQAVHEQSKRDQFLMKLCHEFEITRSNLMNWDPSPSLDCFNCKKYGLIPTNCAKKSCNYCKKQGHFIKECPTRPHNRQATTYQAAVNTSSVLEMFSASSSSTVGLSALTSEMVQQMIMSAFSALGLQVNGITSSKSWLIDSAASNHMTRSSNTLRNVRPYHGSS
ncbi:hypothetical protein EZV62_015770 [Acer yangbiense]|uniref:CCHC-type domain-containing protein n=1 Tax=Acer yangbiense TaxID=1000413 RepID=A0A5C7HLS8_9ROSI|nr:hypothetical protein EZV62_015770 [Acer yangbiense]